MTVVEVTLPDELHRAIDREVRAGRASDEADFLLRAGRFLAEHLDEDDEIQALIALAEADAAAGNFVTVTSAEQTEAMHRAMMARVCARMASEPPNR